MRRAKHLNRNPILRLVETAWQEHQKVIHQCLCRWQLDLLIRIVNTNSCREPATMRLTSFTDFGLRMLMRMASTPERAFSTAELAGEFGLSRNHLAKIMQHLAHSGLIESRRGGGGGATLAHAPQDIRLGDIVRHLEAGQPLVECLGADGGACTLDARCRLKTKLRRAEAAFLRELDHATLADIALPPARDVLFRVPKSHSDGK